MSIIESTRGTKHEWIGGTLSNRGCFFSWLQLQTLFNGNDFFGNIWKEANLCRVIANCRPVCEPKVDAKRKLRRRGYRDKGSYRSDSEKHSLWVDTATQLKIEANRDAYEDTLNFLRGWIE
jgi:hypothetical protein